MPARIIHVGADLCHRVGVLENAGYRVRECSSLSDLRKALASDPQPDAFIVIEDHAGLFRQAVALIRAYSQLPLILFGEPQRNCAETPFEFDLVIPFLVAPDIWLTDVAILIAQGQAVRIRSRMSGTDEAA